ncbi:superkiller viralicidic activity 2-like 2 isoform X2 [Varroa destructor]|uniref:Superkiller viralicidic activity 2-like 2 n=1 Tax=Varroa destructor TaxID=109461 RepID=A0A7M7K1D3_VARDE|nr:superkiller viralicidic activity 2-like 2 isoform X2 [Varroa destructor]
MEDLFSVFENAGASEATQESKKDDGKEVAKLPKDDPTDLVSAILEGDKNKLPDTEGPVKKKPRILEDYNPDEYASRSTIHRVDTVDSCSHEVAVPSGSEFVPLEVKPGPPAREYPFVLDPFQREAILCIENEQSVLVSAHTSAGKTVVAEYSIALALKNKQRVIYTTPIKALSNQKYREFYEEFKDVGLMTGDVTINPTASCLIMTTEILRSMLYRGSEIMREVGWVIFDEIHYMRDKERGVVWEETIILLPDNVHYVFLSATIPNARQFAEWICYLHKQPCHVVYTEYRPVPLQHYIFPAGGDGLHLVVDEKGIFKEDNFNLAMTTLQNAAGNAKGDSGLRGRQGGFRSETNCYKIVKMIMERDYSPVIVFSFSKRECESYATQMSKLDLNTADEKKLVNEVFNNAMEALSDEDRELPQVQQVLPLLMRGIAIHHGGLLPILKETIEILFSEGLIKALFATETFAMGLNMPARTVLFTNPRKFDGQNFRWVTSGEYIQMSGRAGRRGLDDRGIVILMIDEKMSAQAAKDIVKGAPDAINSAFHLTYNMVLNLLRVEGINPEYMLERSFFQFQNYASIPQLYQRLDALQEQLDAMVINREDDVATYFKVQQQLTKSQAELRGYITKPQHIVPFLQAGRMIRVKNKNDDFGWGIIINYKNKKVQTKKHSNLLEEEDVQVIVEALIYVCPGSTEVESIKPPPKGVKGEMQVVPIRLDLIERISSVRLLYPSDLRPLDSRMSVLKSINEVEKRFDKEVPLLDPIEDMDIREAPVKELVKQIAALKERLRSLPLHTEPGLDALYKAYSAKQQVAEQVKQCKADIRKGKSLLQMDELKCRKRVLRRLGYCNNADIIDVKGRIACEISTADELLLTEMIFNNIFNNLNPAQCNAVLSCLVFQEKSNEMPKLTEELMQPLRLMQDMARRIAQVSRDSKLELDEDDYIDQFKPHLMDVVFGWSKGASFGQICKMTDAFEGSIIRCVRRLEELLRQMVQAAKSIGNTELETKFSEAIKLIKRDIVFAASLYL